MPKRILLADDSITIQKVITITFSTEDYELTVVGDGDSALRKAREIRPDLIMADVAMPGKNGYEVCSMVKGDPALRHIPVLLLAGTFEPLNKEEAARAKADDSIIKPFESQELLDKVRGLLESGIPPSAPAQAQGGEEPPPSRLEIGTEGWEAGDFLGFPEAFEEKEKKGAEAPPELEFLDTGALFEEPKKEAAPRREDEFVDLVLTEEELRPEEKPKREPEKLEIPPIEPFDIFREEPFKAAPPWAEEKRPAAEKTEPFGSAAPFASESVEKEGEFPPAETDLLEAYAEEAPKGPGEAPREAPPFGIAAKAEEKVREASVERLKETVGLPREEIEAIVSRIAREVVEKVAWEVVPELAEEIITAEFGKLKEAWAKAR